MVTLRMRFISVKVDVVAPNFVCIHIHKEKYSKRLQEDCLLYVLFASTPSIVAI